MLRDLNSIHDLATALELPTWSLAQSLLVDRPYRRVIVFKNGKMRYTWEPRPELKAIQRRLSRILAEEYVVPWTVHGYVPGRSPITNAENHVGQTFVLNFDLENFFGSIDRNRVIDCLLGEPYRARPAVASKIADIVCFGFGLPAGAPSSPIIANVVLQHLDRQLECLCFHYDCIYTRYSDDMTISTSEATFPPSLAIRIIGHTALGSRLRKIIDTHGFHINHLKTRLSDRSQQQLVTGLVVNDRVNIRRAYIRRIRYELCRWRSHGLGEVEQPSCDAERTMSDYRAILFGRIQHVGLVRGFTDPLYLRLEAEFSQLQAASVGRSRL